MALVKIDHLVEGMVLSENVHDSSSRLLLSKGQALMEKHMRILKMWGVFEVAIDGQGPAEAAHNSVDAEKTAVVSDALRTCFSLLDPEHPAIREILRLSLHHRLNHPSAHNSDKRTDRPREIKPLPKSEILSTLERIDVKLPEVPSLVFELNEILANPNSSAGDIASVVNQSPSLAALLLKIVNSAFYGFRSKIDSIARAVMLIGSKEVSNLALGITIMETFKDIPRQVMDVAGFLEHNLACGVVARLLAAHGKTANSDQLFVSGMLHDIGRLVLCKYFPKTAVTTFGEAIAESQPLLKTELALMGCTHMQIGKKLLQKWKLPYVLENTVYYHHNPSASPYPESAAMVQLADILVHGLGLGESGEQMIPGFDTRCWQRLNLPVSALQTVVHQAVQQIGTFRQMFTKR